MISPNSLDTNVSLTLASIKVQTEIILGTNAVRIHTRIGREPWARLWYLCRALDIEGSGQLTLPLPVVQSFLECSSQSIYRWLQQGQKKQAFRYYTIKDDVMTVYMGSMFKVCYQMNLKRWGAVGVCPLWQVTTQLRSLTTGLVTQKFQQKSRYAADRKLKPDYRKFYGTAHPNELVNDDRQSSPKSPVGEVPRVLHVSSSRIFVSKNFTHYGTSQNAISCELGIHTRTVRRHQQQLQMSRRQLCQQKREYYQIAQAFENDAAEWQAWGSDGTLSTVGYQAFGESVVFSDGFTPGVKKQQPNTYKIKRGEFGGRFFRMGNQMYMSRCNIYREQFKLTTMSAARRKYHYQLSQCQLDENRAGRVGNHLKGGCQSSDI